MSFINLVARLFCRNWIEFLFDVFVIGSVYTGVLHLFVPPLLAWLIRKVTKGSDIAPRNWTRPENLSILINFQPPLGFSN